MNSLVWSWGAFMFVDAVCYTIARVRGQRPSWIRSLTPGSGYYMLVRSYVSATGDK